MVSLEWGGCKVSKDLNAMAPTPYLSKISLPQILPGMVLSRLTSKTSDSSKELSSTF